MIGLLKIEERSPPLLYWQHCPSSALPTKLPNMYYCDNVASILKGECPAEIGRLCNALISYAATCLRHEGQGAGGVSKAKEGLEVSESAVISTGAKL